MAIKIINGENGYIGIEMPTKWNSGRFSTWLTKQELKSLHTKIGKILGVVDWQKEMLADKKKFIK